VPDVFLSYSHEDLAVAQRFARGFERAGFSVWWDRTLRSGDPYDKVTEQALKQAKAVVVLWSSRSVDARWVRAEATIADRLGTLVPVMIEICERPVMFELTQAADLTHWTGNYGDKAWKACLDDVRQAIQKPRSTDTATVAALNPADFEHRPPAPATTSRRWIVGGIAVLLLAGAIAAAWRGGLFNRMSGPRNSVAVLPFTNLSGDASQGYLSDGMAAEVRSELARNEALQIVAQTSSDLFRDSRVDAREIARQLNVAYLLEGNLLRSGDTVRVSAELINGGTGFTRWSRTFEGPVNDLLKVQREIALAIAHALSSEMGLQPAQAQPAGRLGATTSVAAFEAYLRGKELLQRSAGSEVNRAAVASLDNALVIDPEFGAAHAVRARALTALGNQYIQGDERRQAYDEAIRSANTAIRLAPDLADAWSALGFALFSGRLDVRGAEEPYNRSRILGSGDADVLNRYALYKARTGHFREAREAIDRAAALDPMNARLYRSVGAVAFAARRYAESIPPIQRSLDMNPTLNGGWAALGTSQLLLGQVAQAKKSFATERSSLFGLVGVAIIAHREGRQADAQEALDRMVRENGDNSLYQQAQVYAQWGEHRRAMEALKKAREARDAGLGLMLNDPLLDPVRNDPEFTVLLAALGFSKLELQNN